MSTNDSEGDRRGRDWPLLVLGTITLLLGLVLAIGGAWLASLGGSWYYVLAGVGLVLAGAQLARGRLSGAWWFAVVFVGTLAWTIWESGLSYWRWIPRFGLMVVLGFFVALLAPRLAGWRSRAWSRGLAGLMALVFVAAFALAFVPHGVIEAGKPGPAAKAVAPVASAGAAQPADAPADGDWPAYGRNNAAERYSPLAQISRDNVGKLERAWTYRTGDLPDKRWGAETTPLKIGDALYLCSARNVLIALDAVSGKERWRFDPKVPDEAIPYTAACRGVTYFDARIAGAMPAPPPDAVAADANANPDAAAPAVVDAPPAATPAAPTDGAPVSAPAARTALASDAPCATRIIEGTLDARLIAVDARTGKPCADFGDNGQVDITVGMGKTSPGMVSITSAPVIVRGVVVTGHQVLDGQRRWAPSGVIQGFDAITGELRWAWDMMRPDRAGLPPAGETFTRGTPNMWTTASGDEQLGLVYLPMGNSAVDYWSGLRRAEENKYATSLVALDVTTGKKVWSFQAVHNDVWDYDFGSQATLVDFPSAEGTVPALVLPSKQGDMYVLDRRTGRALTPVEERPVPQGGVEPAQRSPTQPFSLYHTLRKPDLTERDMWGMSPVDQMICRIQFRKASYKGFYTPPVTDGHSVEYPGYNGGSDWGGIALDPVRGVIVANYNDMPNYNRLVPRAEADKLGWAPRSQTRGEIGGPEGAGDPQAGTPYAIDVNAGWRLKGTGLLCKEPPYGGIRAIDLRTGKTIWDRPFGTARLNGPFGIPSMLPVTIGTPNNGGAVVTASGLIFIAAATDNLISAIDLKTGKTLWSDVLPAGGQATPMTYESGGRQFVVIMAGGHHFMETKIGDALVAYALPAG
jgi:quinoprotein glucose dehydrogenase